MSAQSLLEGHVAELCERMGVAGRVVPENGRLLIILEGVSFPPGKFSLPSARVLFNADQQYPLSALDMFWTDEAVVLANGSVPERAEVIQTFAGLRWRRFSWHRTNAWNPTGNPLLDHFAFMEHRLLEGR